MNKLSVFIITYNEENNIRDCLESVKWADEIVVVDAMSTDRTVEICREYTDKIFLEPWQGFGRQKALAFEKTSYPWVLNLDADERVTPELKLEIQKLLSQNDTYEGYFIPMQNYFLGKPMKHSGWYPAYHLRLFHKKDDTIRFNPGHGGVSLNGNVGYLKGMLLHYTHPTVKESLVRMNLNSSIEAAARINRKRVRWYHFFVHPVSTFLGRYFFKKGFLDGIHGLMLALMTSMTKLALYLKVWEAQNLEGANEKLMYESLQMKDIFDR